LLTLPSIGLAIALVVAITAYLRARSAIKRLERITESYWELRYETGQLKSRVTRLELTTGLRDGEPEGDMPKPAAASPTTFVPLSSLRK
jgi:hypothetical protein